jgi:3-methyladenine DNA glycosylase Mpg
LNSEDITRSSEIWVEDDGYIVDKNNIFQGARIGIDYAGDYIKKPWRFWIE